MLIRLTIGIVASIIVAGCSPRQDAQKAPDAAEAKIYKSIPAPTRDGVAMHITEPDNGKLVAVVVDTTIQVDLIGVPTAGYMWSVVETPAFLEAAGDTSGPTSEAQFEPGFAGGSHWEVFFFKVTGPGEGVLRLENRPLMDEESPADEVFSVRITAG